MPTYDSAKKAARKSQRRAVRNRAARSTVRTQVRKLERSMDEGDLGAAETSLPEAIQALDRAVTKGILHRNTASRKKSRLTLRYNVAKQAKA